jgi:hypothetical protein
MELIGIVYGRLDAGGVSAPLARTATAHPCGGAQSRTTTGARWRQRR